MDDEFYIKIIKKKPQKRDNLRNNEFWQNRNKIFLTFN